MSVEQENISWGIAEIEQQVTQINENINSISGGLNGISGSLSMIARSLDTLKRLKTFGMIEIQPRNQLRNDYYSFENIVSRLIKQKANNKAQKSELLILGSSMSFLLDGLTPIDSLLDGLRSGVDFKFSLFDPKGNIWDEDDGTKTVRENVKNTLKYLKKRVGKQEFDGTLEIRIRSHLFGSSFSSHVYGGKRVSVYEIYGDSPQKPRERYSQIFEHEPEQKIFPFFLHRVSHEYYNTGQLYFHYPPRAWKVFFCGVKLSKDEPKLVMTKKNTKDARWSIPVVKIDKADVEDEAKNAFQMRYGYSIDIKKRNLTYGDPTTGDADNSIIYVGEVEEELPPSNMEVEVGHFPIKDFLSGRDITFDPNVPDAIKAELKRINEEYPHFVKSS